MATPGDIVYQNILFSRYGDDGLPGNAVIRDEWQKYIQFGHPDLFHADESYPDRFVGGLYGTPMDLHGRYSRGIPNQYFPGSGVPAQLPAADTESGLIAEDEVRNSPYEFSLLSQSRYASAFGDYSDDRPFTAKEVERVLRQYDRDAGGLPSRLWDLTFYDHDGNGATPDLQLIQPGDRHALTFASFETPAIPGLSPVAALGETAGFPVPLNDRVYQLLVNNGFPMANASAMVEELLSYELRVGLPFDLNRPFGDGRDNDGDGIYDEPDELALANEILTAVDGSTVNMNIDQFSRYNFARQLFVLVLLATNDTDFVDPADVNTPQDDDDAIRRFTLAQWVVNVVDFRDSDSICTPFEFDLNPFNVDGWVADGDLATNDGPEVFVVWGCERPELLLTETAVFHDRRSEDLMSAGGGDIGSGDNDFDSRLVPNASAFFELYNPWLSNSTNPLQPDQLHPRELGATNSEDGIDLLQESVAGNPVWRMVVTTESNFSTTYRDVDVRPGIEGIAEAEEFRRIYFVEPNMTLEPVGNRHKVYWPDATVQGLLAGNSFVGPGEYAVIGSSGKNNGSAYETWFGRRMDPPDNWPASLTQTRGITLLPGTQQVEVRSESSPVVTDTYDAVAIPINATISNATTAPITRSLGISDPINGYFDYDTMADVTPVEDGFEFISTKDMPVDQDPSVQLDNFVLQSLRVDGVRTVFRSVFLQRLADPTQAWDAVTNPYLTIDRQLMDLTSFNGAADDISDPLINAGPVQLFASNERGRSRNPDLSLLASPLVTARSRQLWPIEPASEDGNIINQPPLGDTHHFDQEFIASLGTVNLAYDHPDFQIAGEIPVGFAGLTWSNRPFANHMELMDVPFTNTFELLASPETFGVSAPSGQPAVGYTMDRLGAAGDPYSEPVRGGHFGHLLNFFSPGSVLDSDPEGLINLFDFVRVPSRFSGTRIHINTSATLFPPFNTLSRYRVPGKVNVNTIFNTDVMSGWLGPIGQGFIVDGQDVVGAPRTYTNAGLDTSAAGIFEGSRRSPPTGTSRFDDPFRAANSWDKVPVGMPSNDPVSVSLLRNEVGGAIDAPVFAIDGDLPWASPTRDSSSRFELFRRIGATTTTRSSVFAIWITIGYFEVDQHSNLVKIDANTPTERGIEIGADVGKATRSRGFYIFDRSIPVACEPGVNHNVEKAILVESIIK